MRREDLQAYVGKIVGLDLINRERPISVLLEITDDGYAVLKNPYIYIPVPVGTGMQVQALSYAAPLFEVKTIRVALEHIMMRLDLQPQMEQAYIRQTSGIITDTKPSFIIP